MVYPKSLLLYINYVIILFNLNQLLSAIFDMRQHRIVSNLTVHSAAVTRIVLNDTEGYFITGSQDGEIKVKKGLETFENKCPFLFLPLI